MYAKNAGKLVVASGESLDIADVIKKAELPYEWLIKLKAYAEQQGLEFFSSACDELSVDILIKTNVVALKTASYEITHLPLIQHIAKQKKPFILSCGGASMFETSEAVETAQAAGQKQMAILHCIAKYDAPLNTLNLNVLKTLQLQFPELVVGYSDHSSDPVIAPTAAVALGAKLIEKHITLDKRSDGPDHSFALEPEELRLMVRAIRSTEQKIIVGEKIEVDPRVLGTSKRTTFKNEEYVRKFAYRLLYATKKISPGDLFTPENISVLRSGENYKKYYSSGLHPRYYSLITARKYQAKQSLKPGQAVTWNDILSQ